MLSKRMKLIVGAENYGVEDPIPKKVTQKIPNKTFSHKLNRKLKQLIFPWVSAFE